MNALQIFTIVVYLSILYELVGIPVPSIASTYQLFWTEDEYDKASLLKQVRGWRRETKLFALFLPTALSVVIYLLPLLQTMWPPLSQWLFPIPTLNNSVVVVAGVLLTILGRIIALYSAWRIRENNRQKADSFDLKTEGLFARSRNPGLVGMYTCFLGLLLLFPTWIMAVGFFLYVGNMHFRVLLEEDFLAWKFGRNYLDYKASHRRYV